MIEACSATTRPAARESTRSGRDDPEDRHTVWRTLGSSQVVQIFCGADHGCCGKYAQNSNRPHMEMNRRQRTSRSVGRGTIVFGSIVLFFALLGTACEGTQDAIQAGGTAVLPSNLAHGQGLVSKVVKVAESMFRSSWTQQRDSKWEGTKPSTKLNAKKHTGTDRSGFVDVGRRSETPHKLGPTSAATRMPFNAYFQSRGDARKLSRPAGGSDMPCAELYVEGNKQWEVVDEYGGSDGMALQFQQRGHYKGATGGGYPNSYKLNGRNERGAMAGTAGVVQSRPDRFSAPARFGAAGSRRYKGVAHENLDLRHTSSLPMEPPNAPPPPYAEAVRPTITPVHHRRERLSQRNAPPVDQDGHILPNVTRIDRFDILRMVDKGTFGTVFMAWDCKWRQNVALKVVRKVTRYVEDAEFEVSILDKLAALDRKGRYCVKLYKYFHYHGHFCIVTELLGESIYHSLKKMRQARKAVKLSSIWRVATQLCEALSFLRSVNLVHADLKTENILLSRAETRLDDDDLQIKLIDFGGATWQEDLHSKVIQTRHYRAPEVVLGLDWSYPCDMWSVGCILLELYESRLTFDTRDTAQHLAMIRRLVGEIPPYLVRQIPRDHSMERLFDAKGRLRWPELAQNHVEEEAVLRVARLEDRIDPKLHDFTELLRGMLQVDPAKRITPEQALRSRFLYRTPP